MRRQQFGSAISRAKRYRGLHSRELGCVPRKQECHMTSEKDNELELNRHDLREGMSGGVPSGTTKCNLVGQPPATNAKGNIVITPEAGAPSRGQTTNQSAHVNFKS